MSPRSQIFWMLSAAGLLVLAIGFGFFYMYSYDDSPEARAERLVKALCGLEEESLLSQLGLGPDRQENTARDIDELVALGDVGVDALIAKLKEPDNGILWLRMTWIVPEMTGKVDRLLPVIIDAIPGHAPYPLMTLREFGPEAAPAIPAVIPYLNSSEVSFRPLAAVVLADIGTASLPALREALEDPNATTRGWAAVSIAKIAPAAAHREALEILQDSTQCGEKLLERDAREALQTIARWQATTQPASGLPKAKR